MADLEHEQQHGEEQRRGIHHARRNVVGPPPQHIAGKPEGGHFRSLIPGTNINESTLLASDYLNHFHGLVMLLEAVATDPKGFADDLMGWRPLTYEEHFSASGFRDKTLAIAAYRRAPPKIRARFDEAVAKLHGEAVTVIAEIATELKGRNKRRLH
jgi:hypothetical protein